MADTFANHLPGLDSPADNAAAVTAAATALPFLTRALFVGSDGNVTVTMRGGQSVTFANVAAGTILPIRASHVTAATATGIIALW
ncbi:hypothetical protein [Rhodobacter sp. CZR27]|uniref:spike base protein, RCAP_Rcc01079 family n=1 Tax=Rhodobacter sp. CZR27 TaxID=2033869 RepID=UPI000BBE971A|nr:hypothetical protein [Rhodobacter sp. CZR27]